MRLRPISRSFLRRVVPALLLALPLGGAAVTAQEPSTPTARNVAGLAPGEVLRLLDAYAVMQAQDALRLDEMQYPAFVQRFKQLQDARRRHLQTRARLVQDLSQLTRATTNGPDEGAIRRKLTELSEHETAASTEVARARAAVDELLSVVQQGSFRVFEEQMERRKLELLSRARQGARQERRRQPDR